MRIIILTHVRWISTQGMLDITDLNMKPQSGNIFLWSGSIPKFEVSCRSQILEVPSARGSGRHNRTLEAMYL